MNCQKSDLKVFKYINVPQYNDIGVVAVPPLPEPSNEADNSRSHCGGHGR